jgi:hypothetical protein
MLASKQIKHDDRHCYEITPAGRKLHHEPLVEKRLKTPDVWEVRY